MKYPIDVDYLFLDQSAYLVLKTFLIDKSKLI